MDFPDVHRFSRTWMAVTAVVITASLVTAGVFISKASHVKHRAVATATPVPAATAATVKQASADLKTVNLADLKASIAEVKSVVKAFGKQ